MLVLAEDTQSSPPAQGAAGILGGLFLYFPQIRLNALTYLCVKMIITYQLFIDYISVSVTTSAR